MMDTAILRSSASAAIVTVEDSAAVSDVVVTGCTATVMARCRSCAPPGPRRNVRAALLTASTAGVVCVICLTLLETCLRMRAPAASEESGAWLPAAWPSGLATSLSKHSDGRRSRRIGVSSSTSQVDRRLSLRRSCSMYNCSSEHASSALAAPALAATTSTWPTKFGLALYLDPTVADAAGRTPRGLSASSPKMFSIALLRSRSTALPVRCTSLWAAHGTRTLSEEDGRVEQRIAKLGRLRKRTRAPPFSSAATASRPASGSGRASAPPRGSLPRRPS